jgi:hypothetical protein
MLIQCCAWLRLFRRCILSKVFVWIDLKIGGVAFTPVRFVKIRYFCRQNQNAQIFVILQLLHWYSFKRYWDKLSGGAIIFKILPLLDELYHFLKFSQNTFSLRWLDMVSDAGQKNSASSSFGVLCDITQKSPVNWLIFGFLNKSLGLFLLKRVGNLSEMKSMMHSVYVLRLFLSPFFSSHLWAWQCRGERIPSSDWRENTTWWVGDFWLTCRERSLYNHMASVSRARFVTTGVIDPKRCTYVPLGNSQTKFRSSLILGLAKGAKTENPKGATTPELMAGSFLNFYRRYI